MKNFILASRPKTLLAAVLPPLVSFVWVKANGLEIGWYALCCVISALCIQLATNFFNDYLDHEKGADKVRLGPTRVTSSGLVSSKTIRSWAITSLVIATLFALPLIYRGGPVIALMGVVSLYLSYGYTGGPWPLAYKGLGEVFVFLFFGLFAVLGSYYIYTKTLTLDALILASIFGLLSTTLICVNNLRDRVEDMKVNKRTLATRMDERSYQVLILFTIFIPYLLSFSLTSLNTTWMLVLPFPIGVKLALIILREKRERLNLGLKFGGIHLILFSLTLILLNHYENLFS